MLKAIHTAELSRRDGGRNVLKLLSVNTRRTKVVALSTGTHRVPDELRRHQLADGTGTQALHPIELLAQQLTPNDQH